MLRWVRLVLGCGALVSTMPAWAQPADMPAPDDDADQPYAQPYPDAPPAAPPPSPAPPASAPPPPVQSPSPAPPPPQPQPVPAQQQQPVNPPQPTQAPPAPRPAPPPPPPPSEQAQGEQPYLQPYGGAQQQPAPAPAQPTYGPPPPRPRPGDDPAADGRGGSGFEVPDFSVRIDPLNWLLHGRLGVELEAVLIGPLTLELVPVFVTDTHPPLLNLSGIDSEVSQHSNGIGAIAGSSIGAGIWLSGTPFQGTALRVLFTNYSYTYRAKAGGEQVDQVSHVERRFAVMINSMRRFGFFTIESGIGLGYELNQQERCGLNQVTPPGQLDAVRSGCGEELLIGLDRFGNSVMDLNGWAHPVYLIGRISLGVTID